MAHSPEPWTIGDDGELRDATRMCLESKTDDGTYLGLTREDMERIVHCVNMHDELVAALQTMLNECAVSAQQERSATRAEIERAYGAEYALLAKAKWSA